MYTEYQPSHLLAPYIDNYWEFKGNPEYGMRIHILPDGCTDFIFTLGEVADTVEEESLIMQPYRSYFGADDEIFRTDYIFRIGSYVWCSFFALRIVLFYKVAFT